MCQSFDARLQLHKRAKVHEPGDLSMYNAIQGIFFLDTVPWARQELLEAKANLAFFAIQSKDYDLKLLAKLHQIGGVLGSRPTHFADVQEAVDTSEIKKGSKILYV